VTGLSAVEPHIAGVQTRGKEGLNRNTLKPFLAAEHTPRIPYLVDGDLCVIRLTNFSDGVRRASNFFSESVDGLKGGMAGYTVFDPALLLRRGIAIHATRQPRGKIECWLPMDRKSFPHCFGASPAGSESVSSWLSASSMLAHIFGWPVTCNCPTTPRHLIASA